VKRHVPHAMTWAALKGESMNFFNHRDKPAIGVCKSCGKGLCEDCLTELSNGIACKGSCEKQVNLLNRVTDSDAEIKSEARLRLYDTGVRSFFLGIDAVFAIGAVAVMIYFEKDNPPIVFIAYLIAILATLAFIPPAIYELVTGIFRLRRKMQSLHNQRKDYVKENIHYVN
jgi:hypothetical protein